MFLEHLCSDQQHRLWYGFILLVKGLFGWYRCIHTQVLSQWSTEVKHCCCGHRLRLHRPHSNEKKILGRKGCATKSLKQLTVVIMESCKTQDYLYKRLGSRESEGRGASPPLRQVQAVCPKEVKLKQWVKPDKVFFGRWFATSLWFQ